MNEKFDVVGLDGLKDDVIGAVGHRLHETSEVGRWLRPIYDTTKKGVEYVDGRDT